MAYIFFFILGVIVGSFLNVLILRKGTGLSPFSGRSKCFSCDKTLAWYELLPVISFIYQKGKCSKCKTPISYQYILVEITSGFIFLYSYYLYVSESLIFFYLVLYIAIFSTLLLIFVYDLKHKIIPDEWSLLFALLSIPVALHRFGVNFYGNDFLRYTDLLAGLIFFIPFYALWKYSEGHWIGLGDGKLVIGIGFLLGFAEGVSALALSFWIGAIVSLAFMSIQKVIPRLPLKRSFSHLTMKSEVPFAPFLVIGTVIVFMTRIDLLSLHAFGF